MGIMFNAIKKWFAPQSTEVAETRAPEPETKKRGVQMMDAASTLPYDFPSNSKSGQSVTPETALTYSAVWQAIKMISGDISKLPLLLYALDPDGTKTIDKTHPAFRLVARKSNRDMSARTFWAQMLVEYLLYNKSFAYIARNSTNQTPLEMWPIPTATVYQMDTWQYFNELPPNLPRYVYATYYPEAYFILMPREVFHVRGLEVVRQTRWQHQFKQPSWWEKARDSIGLALASEEFNSRFFKNGAMVGGVLAIPPNYTDKAAKNLEEGFRKRYGSSEAAFKVAILRDGAKFIPMQQDAEKSQMHELREDQVYEIARWFNLPPSKLGLDATVSYSSKSEDNRNYYDQTLSPIMAAITSESWDKLLTTQQKQVDTHCFEYELTRLLQTDRKTLSDVSAQELVNGVITFNEYRDRLNMNPIEGGDKRLVPLNMAVVDEQGNVMEIAESETDQPQEPAGETETEPDTEPETDAESVRMARVYVSTELSRIKSTVRRKNPTAFVTWWDERTRSKLLTNFESDLDRLLDSTNEEMLADDVSELIEEYREGLDQWNEVTQPLRRQRARIPTAIES